MRIKLQRRAGFTLVEIVIVVLIIGVIMAWGLPTFVQTFRRTPLQEATNNLMDGCISARAAAIMSGTTTELVVAANEDGKTSISVSGGASGTFSATMPQEVGFEMLAVNFIDVVKNGGSDVKVRFFANGTSEEFTAVVLDPTSGQRRMVQLDVITGMPVLKTGDEIAQIKK